MRPKVWHAKDALSKTAWSNSWRSISFHNYPAWCKTMTPVVNGRCFLCELPKLLSTFQKVKCMCWGQIAFSQCNFWSSRTNTTVVRSCTKMETIVLGNLPQRNGGPHTQRPEKPLGGFQWCTEEWGILKKRHFCTIAARHLPGWGGWIPVGAEFCPVHRQGEVETLSKRKLFNKLLTRRIL